MSEYDNEMKEMNLSKNNYERGKKCQVEKKYKTAISYYSSVIEGDVNYKSAQKNIEECKEYEKEEVLRKIDLQLASDSLEYIDVLNEISNNDYLSKDDKIKEKFPKLKKKIKDIIIYEIEQLVKKSNYIDALLIIEKDIPEVIKQDEQIMGLISDTREKMIQSVISKVDSYMAQNNYEKAENILSMYMEYDTENKLSKKLSVVKKGLKRSNISQFKALLNKLNIKYDSVDQEYTVVSKGYSTEYINTSSYINIEARVTVDKKEKVSDFDLVVGFVQDDWIFTELVTFASGKYRETFLIDYSERYTQVLNGVIAEWMYLEKLSYTTLFGENIIDKLIDKITTEKKATIRFSADGNGRRNHVITSSEKSNIKNVKKFFDMLEKYPYLYKYI